MKGPAEAAAATGRGGRSRVSARPDAPPPDLTMGARRARACAATEAKHPSRGGRSSRPRAALTCAARAIAPRHPHFRSVVAVLAERARQLRARGKRLLSSSRAGSVSRRFTQGMRTVGLAARRLRLCDAAVKPFFPLSRSCRTRGPWRLCGPEAKRFAGCSAGPSPAVTFGWALSALRSAGMLRPAG